MINKELKKDISVVETDKNYPEFPYHNDSHLRFALLDLLEGLGLSRENPFASYIGSGQTVLIKPNWVRDRNPLGYNIESLVTHPSLIKYLIDLLSIAMDGTGKIIIGDAPLQNCNFDNLSKQIRIDEIVESAKNKNPNLEIIVEDWRITTMLSSNPDNKNVQNFKFSEDQALGEGYNLVDLGKESFLEDISEYADRFRITKYKSSLMRRHHSFGKHEYLITRRISEANFMINLPKMKTHIKAGLTCAMKNLVGINGHKEFLPHHIKGSSEEGGDNYKKASWWKRRYEDLYDYVWENVNNLEPIKRKVLMKVLQIFLKISDFFGGDKITAGSWSGNKTVWRTTLDLNHIAYFGFKNPLKILNIVDGVVAGEGEGPLEPTPKPIGILIAGENPALVDVLVAKMIGYDLLNIPTTYNALHDERSMFSVAPVDGFEINFHNHLNRKKINLKNIPDFKFVKPHFWK